MTLSDFLINPTEEKLESLPNKEQAIRILRTLTCSAKALYFFYKRGESVEITKCVKLMIEEKLDDDLRDLLVSVISDMKAIKEIDDEKIRWQSKVDLIYLNMIANSVVISNNTELLAIVLDSELCEFDLNRLALKAADYTALSVVSYLVEKGASNKKDILSIVEDDRKIYNINCNVDGCDELAVTVAKSGNIDVLNYMIENDTPNHERLREIYKKNKEFTDCITLLSE